MLIIYMNFIAQALEKRLDMDKGSQSSLSLSRKDFVRFWMIFWLFICHSPFNQKLNIFYEKNFLTMKCGDPSMWRLVGRDEDSIEEALFETLGVLVHKNIGPYER